MAPLSLWLGVIGMIVVASACAAPTGSPTAAPHSPSVPSPSPLANNSPNPKLQTAQDAVVGAAASHLGVGRDQLRVEQAEARQWGDSSLGCPRPGEFYSQVVTPGFLFVIGAPGGKQLEYHTDTRGTTVLCQER